MNEQVYEINIVFIADELNTKQKCKFNEVLNLDGVISVISNFAQTYKIVECSITNVTERER